MKRLFAGFILTACVVTCVACGGMATSPSSNVASPGNAIVGFDSLSVDAASVITYTESGFKVSAMSGDWSVRTTYGNPSPLIQFWAPGGSTVVGEIQVGAAGSAFYFKSVDLYSSTTPIPYTIKGLRKSSTVFTTLRGITASPGCNSQGSRSTCQPATTCRSHKASRSRQTRHSRFN